MMRSKEIAQLVDVFHTSLKTCGSAAPMSKSAYYTSEIQAQGMNTIRWPSPTELVNCSFIGSLALEKLDKEWLRKMHGIELWFPYIHTYMCMQKYSQRKRRGDEEGRWREGKQRKREQENVMIQLLLVGVRNKKGKGEKLKYF